MTLSPATLAERFPLINELLTTRLGAAVGAAAALVLAVNAALFAHAAASADNYVTVYGPVIGGDFIVFDTAAETVVNGEARVLYSEYGLSARLEAAFPTAGDIRLSWQYPPTMFLIVAGLALFPYLSSYAVWIGGGGALFLAALRPILRDRLALLAVLASPAVMQAFITGQTGFLTGGLIGLAAYYADRRPILAGLAAGFLTFKPQLGLLIPVAFAAAGAWRAFAYAALTALAFAAATAAVFGIGVWADFAGAFAEHGGRIQSDVFPFEKLVSVYGGAVMLGAPLVVAMALQIAASVGLAAVIWIFHRRVKDADLRLAALASATLLAAPNAFYYELTLCLPALVVVARRGAAGGWLAGERPILAGLWIAPMLIPNLGAAPGPPLGFLTALAAFALVARRGLLRDATRA